MRVPSTSALILGLALAALGCRARSPTVVAERADPSVVKSSDPADRCLRFAGEPGDPNLLGIARTEPVRCCPSDYGFDPQLAQQSCGFAEYLGESEELACVHRFRGEDEQVHELRLTPILDLDLDRAVALHELGTGQLSETPNLQGIRWSAVDERRWALVDGWSIVRRLGWDQSACAPEQMLPVLVRMHEAADDPGAAVALPRVHDERDRSERPAASLLAFAGEAAEPRRRHPLPRAAEALVHELLRTAIADDRQAFAALLEPDARIGLPDRRQLGARAILGADGLALAIRQLLDAAARFPVDAELRCPVIDRRAEPRVTRGEASMWCFWISDDGLDLLVFGLRGRVLDGEADGCVDYIGAFPVRPERPLVLLGEPPPPPVVPTPELVCGDPHARAYPGVCPEPEPADQDEEDEDEQP